MRNIRLVFNIVHFIPFLLVVARRVLFSAESIKLLLVEIQRRIPFSENIEITMEANPGTVEAERFKGYVDAGVTRISMGIQSFNDDKLQRLGRIHNAAEAKSAVSLAKVSGLKKFQSRFNARLAKSNA